MSAMAFGRCTDSEIREMSLFDMLLKSRKTFIFYGIFRVQGSAVHAAEMCWGTEGHEVVGALWFTGSFLQRIT